MGAPEFQIGRFDAVAIASSTGAPGLVEKIIAGLPADLPVPIFVAQHLPPQFTGTFANQLDRVGALSAVEAQDGMSVVPGMVYVGPGHHHMRVRRVTRDRVEIEVSVEPTYLVYKPSADELFRACAKAYGKGTLGVVMSGIGRDGTEGARAIRDVGGVVLTQDQTSCAVYGMPRSVVEAGFSDAVLTPEEIGKSILQLSPGHGKPGPGGGVVRSGWGH